MTTIEVHDTLAQNVEAVLDLEGHNSKSEFVRDCVRRRLEELEEEKGYQFGVCRNCGQAGEWSSTDECPACGALSPE